MPDMVIIHTIDDLRAVFDAAARAEQPLLAATAEWAGIAHGTLYWAKAVDAAQAATPAAPVTVALHCADDAAAAMAALREGWRHILFSGNLAVRGKIADIAAQCGAELLDAPDETAFDLVGRADQAAALQSWIESRRRCK